MPKNNESLNKELYSLLKTRGFDPIPKDATGETSPVPDDADVFKFTFKHDNQVKGTAYATIDGNNTLTVYYDDEVVSEEVGGVDDVNMSWTNFLKYLKMWAQRRQMGFDLENKDHLHSDMAQRDYVKKQEVAESKKKLMNKGTTMPNISEGYYAMGKNSSYNDNIPTVKIILQHSRQIQEGEQRYRNVARIYLENTQGERFLAPTVKPGIAQVYARHLAESGIVNDERWNHIKSLCEEYSKMAGFVRAVRGNQFNESAQKLVEAGLNHYVSLRETLGKMRGNRGYNSYFESWTPTLMETDGDEISINELFVQETVDPRIESVMPILSKLSKNLSEVKEVKELEEWANGLLEAPGAETLAHNQSTEQSRLKALDLDEDDIGDAEAAKKKMNVPAFQRKAQGGDWKVSQKDLDAMPAGTRTTSQGLAAHAKRVGLGEAEGLDPDTQRLERDIRNALENGDDYTAKQYAKMAPTPEAKKYLLKIIKQEMYGTDPEKGMDEGSSGSLDQIRAGTKPTELTPGQQADIKIKTPAYKREKVTTTDVEKSKEKNISGPEGLAALSKKLGQIEEDLGPEQKRVGQLGPTEKVKKNSGARGKLVGANESVEQGVTEGQLNDYGPSLPLVIKQLFDAHSGDFQQYLATGSVSPKFMEALKEWIWHTPWAPVSGPVDEDPDWNRIFITDKYAILPHLAQRYWPIYKKQGVAEGSTSKEKQKTPYRDINSPEYKAAAEKQKKKIANDQAAEPGNKLLDKIKKKGVAEGKWSHNAITGQKLDPRTGEILPVKEKPLTMKQMFAPKAQPKLTLDDVWRKVENVVSQIYPDGDPNDYMAPWLEKHGIRDFKIGEILDRAAKKNGYKDMYDYWNSMGEQGVAEGKNSLGLRFNNSKLSEFIDDTGKYLKPPAGPIQPPKPPQNIDTDRSGGRNDPINEIKNFLMNNGYLVRDAKIQPRDRQKGITVIEKFIAKKRITKGSLRGQVHALEFVIFEPRYRKDKEVGVGWFDNFTEMSGNDTIQGQNAQRESEEFIQSIESLVAQANGDKDFIESVEQGVAEGLSEMDNRTPSGDRKEQRNYSPEEIAKREKEQQARLKSISPEMRKKLRLPEPKEGVAEGQEDLDALKKLMGK